jgi:bacillithiol synthase
LFECHQVGMPLVYPRLSFTLVERKVGKVLEKFGLDVESFRRPVQELVSAAVRAGVPDTVQAALQVLRASLQEGYGAVQEAVEAVDPTLKGPVSTARNEAVRGLSEVEKKVRQHVKARQESELEQIAKAAANLAPLGKPQERVLNMHQYLARYGPELVGSILEAMEEKLMVGARDPAAL